MKYSSSWTEKLLSWFADHRREFPWRRESPRNPYDVWVSEIMLQQTRTETVKPYFERWKEIFPTIQALANADESEVLHAWQGLGYYSRARHLHEGAQMVMSCYDGKLPETRKEIMTIPGIGDYTAGAILSLAYGKHEAAIDGNVLRVYARLYGIHDDVLKTSGRQKIAEKVKETLPLYAGDFNEALMDFASEICLPKHPRCGECPLKADCTALAQNEIDILPYRTPKKKQKTYEAICAVVIKQGKVLFHKRPDKGMLASMWECPMILGTSVTDARHELETYLQGKAEEKIWEHTHIFTHRIWRMKAYLFSKITVPSGEYAWFSPEEYKKIPLAGPHGKLAAVIEKYVE